MPTRTLSSAPRWRSHLEAKVRQRLRAKRMAAYKRTVAYVEHQRAELQRQLAEIRVDGHEQPVNRMN